MLISVANALVVNPVKAYFETFLHESKDENLLKRISDKAVIIFGTLAALSTVFSIGAGVRYGVTAGLDYVLIALSGDATLATGDVAFLLLTFKVALYVAAISIFAFIATSKLQTYLHQEGKHA